MTNPAYRIKRDLIAQWLLDSFDDSDEDPPYARYWRDASDLIKYLAAHQHQIRKMPDADELADDLTELLDEHWGTAWTKDDARLFEALLTLVIKTFGVQES